MTAISKVSLTVTNIFIQNPFNMIDDADWMISQLAGSVANHRRDSHTNPKELVSFYWGDRWTNKPKITQTCQKYTGTPKIHNIFLIQFNEYYLGNLGNLDSDTFRHPRLYPCRVIVIFYCKINKYFMLAFSLCFLKY